MLEKLPQLTEARIKILSCLTVDSWVSLICQFRLGCAVTRRFFIFIASERPGSDELIKWLQVNGVDAKIHYPTAMHLQPASRNLGYSEGDFPVAERAARQTVSLPVHEFVSDDDLHSMISLITEFYGN